MRYRFEKMAEKHRTAVIDIFNYFIENGFAAFFDEPMGDNFFDKFLEMSKGYPSTVVLDESGQVIGFAFLRRFHLAKSLDRTADITYFIMPEHTRKGIGTEILNRFIKESKKLGIDNILASVSSRNEASLKFHLKNGFLERGRLRNVGTKFGRDFDVVLMQLSF